MAADPPLKVPELSYAGVGFVSPTRRLFDRLADRLPVEDLRDLTEPDDQPPYGLQGVAFYRWTRYPEARLYEFFWPAFGASRWAVFRGVAAESQVTAMIAGASDSDGNATKAKFVMRSNIPPGDTATPDNAGWVWVETDLYMLPPRVLAETDRKRGERLYLVTLVDERYFWQFDHAGAVNLQGQQSSWSGLLAYLAGQLQITVPAYAVDAAYGSPEPDSWLYSQSENQAVLTDAVAANVGAVLWKKMSGTWSLYAHGDINRNATVNALGSAAGRGLEIAGGRILRVVGSRPPAAPAPDIVGQARRFALPEFVLVTFPKYVLGQGYYEPVNTRDRVTQNYGDCFTLQYATDAVSSGRYKGLGVTAGTTKVLRDTAKAVYKSGQDVAGDPSNVAAVKALAERVAADWLDSQLGCLDVAFAGIAPYYPFADSLFTWRPKDLGGCRTRLQRMPSNWGYSQLQHSLGPVAAPITCVPGVVTGGSCSGSNVVLTTKTLRIDWLGRKVTLVADGSCP